jgi:hypothetical protein
MLLLLLTLPAVVQAQFYFTTNNGAITITKYTDYGGYGGAVIVPSTTNGYPVTSIGANAFYFRDRPASVTIPDSVTSIGAWAFENCSSLTNVTLSGSLASLPDGVFENCTSLTTVTIPSTVTDIGEYVFFGCSLLASITVPDNVTRIEFEAFYRCYSLANVTIGKSVASIEYEAFLGCSSLTAITVDPQNSTYSSVAGVLFNKNRTTLIQYPEAKAGSYTVPDGVTSIGDDAFMNCTSLTGVYFQGNAPSLGWYVFNGANNATVYYLPGTTGWGPTFGGRPAVRWDPPAIQTSPQTQTAEAGSAVGLRVKASGASPLFCVWYLNDTNLISCSTYRELNLTNLQLSQSGAYTVVISNVLGAVTSAPVMLNVIAPVERRPVPGVKVTGEAGSLLNVDYANSLSRAPNWTSLGSVSLTSTPQYCFDLTLPLPPQRFYRAWQTDTPSVLPSLSLPGMVPAIKLTGNPGDSVRLDYINRFGPIDAWATLDTVTLTNTSQLYFDVSAPGQPQRLYRIVPSP